MANPCILILGGSGTLGGPLGVRAESCGYEVVSTYLTNPDRVRAGLPVQLDLRDDQALRHVVQTFAPDVIIHTAITERSGGDYDAAIRRSGQHVAQIAAECGARLIALSTDLVFDGSEPVYTEDSVPRAAPVNDRYGGAKIDYERTILAGVPSALIVRTSLIYDFDPANAQAAWMIRTIQRGDPVVLYTDQLRCPIWVHNLADALLELAEIDVSGLLHVVGPELVSRYDLGVALLEALGYDPAVHVRGAAMPDGPVRSLNLSIERAKSLLQKTRLLTIEQARMSLG